MKKLKVSDVYTRFIVNVEEYGIFNWMARDVTSGGAVYYPLIQDFIDSNNGFVLDIDYFYGHSAEKYFSPLMIKLLEIACDLNGYTIDDLINHNVPDVDLSAIVEDLQKHDSICHLCEIIYQRFAFKWKKIWDALKTQYKPLDNYSMLEERTPDITKETTYDTTDERTPDLTKTTNGTGNTTTDGETNIFGFNSTSGNPSSSMSGNQTDTITDRTETETGTDTATKTGTITDTESGKETIERSGNIGVTSSQQMLEQEWQVRQHDFYEMIYRDIDSILCLETY